MNLQITLKWLGNWVVLLLLSMFVTENVFFATPEIDPSAVQITLALCYSWLSILLIPVNSSQIAQLKTTLLWAALAAVGFHILSASPFYFEQGNHSFQLTGGVLVLILLLGGMQSLIGAYTSSRASSMTLLTLIAGVFFAAPLYLGVVAEATSHQVVVDSIIAASPLSYLAGIADYDYLRSSWFYQHTPFGGLRFDYPAPGVMTVYYVSITLALAGANIFKNRMETRTLKQ